jgi:hypothetical protein
LVRILAGETSLQNLSTALVGEICIGCRCRIVAGRGGNIGLFTASHCLSAAVWARGSWRHFSRGSQRSRCVKMSHATDEQMICMRSPFVRSCPEQGIRPFPGCGFKCCRRVWNDSGCVMLCPNESQCTNTWLCRRKGAPSTVVDLLCSDTCMQKACVSPNRRLMEKSVHSH